MKVTNFIASALIAYSLTISNAFPQEKRESQLENKLKQLATMAKKCGEKEDYSDIINGKKLNQIWAYEVRAWYPKGHTLEFQYEDYGNVTGIDNSFSLKEYNIKSGFSRFVSGDKTHISKDGGLWFCNLKQRPTAIVIKELNKYADYMIKQLKERKECK